MKYEWRKYINEMRLHGYAVVVLSPVELGNVPAQAVEDELVRMSQDVIDCWQEI